MRKSRIFCSTIGVRGPEGRIRIEIADGAEYGRPGLYRLRLDRVWHDVDGRPAFYTAAQIGELVSRLAFGDGIDPEPLPVLPRGSRVNVLTVPAEGDMPERREGGWTMTDPIRAQDGLVHVGVSVYGKGIIMVPVNTLQVVGRKYGDRD